MRLYQQTPKEAMLCFQQGQILKYISDSKITTTGSGSARGLDATYGGYIEADNVTLMTTLEKMLPKKEVKTKEEVYADILTAYKKLKIQNTRLNQYMEKGISEIQAEIYNRCTNY